MRYVLTILFEMSNEAEHAEAWVSMSRRDRLLARICGLRFSWHYADAARRPSWFMRMWARYPLEPCNLFIDALIDAITAAVMLCKRACGCGCGCGPRELPEDEGAEEGEAGAEKDEGAAPGEAQQPVVEGALAVARFSTRAVPVSGTVRMRRPSALGRRRSGSVPSLEQQQRSSTHLGQRAPAVEDDDVVETEEEIREAMEDEFTVAVRARVLRATGLAGVYAAWGILTWFVFAYGLLIYQQLGMGAERTFAIGWLVSLGVDNASQWRDILVEAAKGAALVVLLDALWVLPNGRWMEGHLDVASVHATLLAGGAVSRWRRLRAHLDFFAYVED